MRKAQGRFQSNDKETQSKSFIAVKNRSPIFDRKTMDTAYHHGQNILAPLAPLRFAYSNHTAIGLQLSLSTDITPHRHIFPIKRQLLYYVIHMFTGVVHRVNRMIYQHVAN